MMRVADGNCKGICSIFAIYFHPGQQHGHHGMDLPLASMANTNDRFLDRIGGIFRNLQPFEGRREQHNTACLPQLEGGRRVLVHKGFFNSRGGWQPGIEHGIKFFMQGNKPRCSRRLGIGDNGAIGNMPQIDASGFDDTPASPPQAGIKPQ